MLESLEGINFQKHSQIEVEFDPKITIITGDSDTGKSALLRLLRWIALNQPGGDDFIREGSLFASGKLKIDGHEIGRRKGKGENLYELDGNEFRAFGVGIPDPISDVLQIGQQNFQGQLDPVFWLQNTGGEVSRSLNSVVDLSIIDKALGEVAGKVRHAQSMVQTTSERLKGLKAKRDETAWIKVADQDFQAVEQKKESLDKLTSFTFRLGQALDSIRLEKTRVQTAQNRLQDILRVGSLAAALGRIGEKAGRLAQALKEIRRQQCIIEQGAPDFSVVEALFEKSVAISRRCRKLEAILTQIRKNKQLAEELPDFSEVQTAFEKHTACSYKRKRLGSRIAEIKKAQKLVTETFQQWESLAEEFQTATEGMCPICGNELTLDKETEHGCVSSK